MGQKSIVEDDIILLVDNAEEIVQSVRNTVLNLDSTVAAFYRESIRACQEGLLLSSCICLGAASEATLNLLAEAVRICNPSYQKKVLMSHTSRRT